MSSVVFNMNCMEYMRWLKNDEFELAIVDPPYGIQEITGRHFAGFGDGGKLENRAFKKDKSKSRKWDFSPKKEYFEELFWISKNQIIWGENRGVCFILLVGVLCEWFCRG